MKCEAFRLGEITLNFDRKRIPLSAKQRAEKQGGYPYYGAQGIIDYVNDYIFDGTYLLIAEDGENLKSKKQNIAQIAKGKFWVNNHAHIVQTNELCNLLYLYYLINSMDLSGYITGSAQPKLSQANLNTVTLQLPSIHVQNKIVSILSSIDDKIELNNAINNNLEQQAALLFDENYSNNNYDISTLGDVATIKYGKGLPTKNLTSQGFPVFGGNGIIGRYTHFMYEEPQVLVSCRGAASGNIMESYPNSFVTNNSLVLEWNDYRYYEFYKQFFFANPLYSYATGSAQPQITIDNIRNVPVPCPKYDEISELCSTLKSISAAYYENIVENNKFATLRDTLLPKLMSGELDVSDIDL